MNVMMPRRACLAEITREETRRGEARRGAAFGAIGLSLQLRNTYTVCRATTVHVGVLIGVEYRDEYTC
jgi:hypothetical protein